MTQGTLDRLKGYDANLEKGEVNESYEVSYLHPDRVHRTVEVTERPEFDERGGPIAILGIIKHFTERNKQEQELRRAATVFDNTNEGSIVTDADQEIIVVNKACTRITGYEPREVLGKNPGIQQSGDHDKAFYDKLWL